MSRTCKKCDEPLPWWTFVDGKKRCLKGRKYCLTCSPFGEHNTKKLHLPDTTAVAKVCLDCGKEFSTKSQARCGACNYQRQWKRRKQKVYSLVGTACWHCGYDRGLDGISVLEFHHMNPADKQRNVSRREIATLRWETVLCEMKKCCLLCCRCHREFHCGLISDVEIASAYKRGWNAA